MIARFHFKICEKTIKTQIYFPPQPDEMNKIKHLSNFLMSAIIHLFINILTLNVIT